MKPTVDNLEYYPENMVHLILTQFYKLNLYIITKVIIRPINSSSNDKNLINMFINCAIGQVAIDGIKAIMRI